MLYLELLKQPVSASWREILSMLKLEIVHLSKSFHNSTKLTNLWLMILKLMKPLTVSVSVSLYFGHGVDWIFYGACKLKFLYNQMEDVLGHPILFILLFLHSSKIKSTQNEMYTMTLNFLYSWVLFFSFLYVSQLLDFPFITLFLFFSFF